MPSTGPHYAHAPGPYPSPAPAPPAAAAAVAVTSASAAASGSSPSSWLTTLSSQLASLPPSVRAVGLVVLCVGLLFLVSSYFKWNPFVSGEAEGKKAAAAVANSKAGGPASSGSPATAALVPLVHAAAEAATKAGKAANPYQQLLHVQWAMANLQAVHKVSPDISNEQLSEASGIHVSKLEEFLNRAQSSCIQQLGSGNKASSSASAASAEQGGGDGR
jgi:hypothetical protein